MPLSLIVLIAAFLMIRNASFPAVRKDSPELYHDTLDEAELREADEASVTISNDRFELVLSTDTTHFTVRDKKSGQMYSSVPYDGDGSGSNYEIRLVYYDANSSKGYLDSDANSVSGDFYSVSAGEDSIRVDYTVRRSKTKVFVPSVFTEERFEEICDKLSDGQSRRLRRFYSLYSPGDDSSQARDMKAVYPVLNETALYIANDSLQEHVYPEITEYMDEAGYGQDGYSEDLNSLEIEENSDLTSSAAFTVPVEYTLTDVGFSARILSDRIIEESSAYKLTEIELLPFFGAVKDSDGFILVPDGSGAVIELSERPGVSFSKKIYGTDQTIEMGQTAVPSQDGGLPCAAIGSKEGSYMIYVSGAAAVSSLNARTRGSENQYSQVYSSFAVRDFDLSDISALSNKAAFNIYSKAFADAIPETEYFLLAPSCSYSDCAAALREHLIETGVLSERTQDDTPDLYLDFTGYETYEDSFIGIKKDSSLVFSTIEEIAKAADILDSEGIGDINVRLKAYGHRGLFNTINNGFDLDRCVGTSEELTELAKLLKERSGKLYLENNISTVYVTGDGFSKNRDAVRNLKKTVSKAYDFDMVSGTNEHAAKRYYLVSPGIFDSLTENFIESVPREIKENRLTGYSWSSFASNLYSDFTSDAVFDRTVAMKASIKAMKRAADVFSGVISDGCFDYSLGICDAMLNMPLSSSGLRSESYPVPFYQMVIHGYTGYTGAPVNACANPEMLLLQSAECGADLLYSFYTSDDSPLLIADTGRYSYPVHFGSWCDDMVSTFTRYRSEMEGLGDQIISGHERHGDLAVTTYENGTRVCVNYGYTEIVFDGAEIGPRDYRVLVR